uniref:Uncharacterized protein n=1 Tax=Anguilla anguilla TaxID=7936 RepID=A0A0E9U8W7_ANGAN
MQPSAISYTTEGYSFTNITEEDVMSM